MEPQDHPRDQQTAQEKKTPAPDPGSRSDDSRELSESVNLLGKETAELSREEYEKLLDMYDDTLRNLTEEQVVKGRVIKVLPNEVIVDVGYKSEGVIDVDEFTDREGKVNVQEGDEVEVLLELT